MEKEEKFKLNGMLWIELEGDPVIGPGRIQLLKNILESGSIRQAAIQMGMSYRKAWDLIEHMNGKMDAPVVTSSRGGKGGGQATVTEKGISAIKEFDAFYDKFQQFLAKHTPDIEL